MGEPKATPRTPRRGASLLEVIVSKHPHPASRGDRRAAADRRQAARTRFYRRTLAYLSALMPYHCAGGVVPDAEAIIQEEGRKHRDHRKPCSCVFCSSGRRYCGPTIQERRDAPLLPDE